MSTVDGIPIVAALTAVRTATATIAGSVADERARTAGLKLDRMLARWLSLEIHRPVVAARFAADRAALAARGAGLLGQSPSPELAELARALTTTSGTAPSSEVRALLRDMLAADLTERRAFEQATDQVRSGTPGADPGRLPCSVDAVSWERYLKEKWPGSPTGRVRAVEELTGGISKRTYLVALEPPDSTDEEPLPDRMVIRMDTGHFPTTVLDEYRLLQRLSRAGVPVPEPLWLEDSVTPFGHPFLVTRCVPGSAPGTLFEAEGSARQAAVALAEGLAALHTVPVGDLVDAPPRSAADLVAAQLDEAEARWRSAMTAPSVPMEIGFAALRDRVGHIDGPAAVVHGECGLQNILIEEGRLRGVLDWEFWHVGDPAEDLAYCRPAVEQLMPWEEFMTCYAECGGPAVSAERLGFFDVWCQLRNAVLAAGILHDFASGRVSGVNLLVTAIDTYRRVEVQLGECVQRLIR